MAISSSSQRYPAKAASRASILGLVFTFALLSVTPAMAVEMQGLPSPIPVSSAPQGLDLDAKPKAPPQKPSVLKTWWFWTAVGAAAATGIVLVAVSNRGTSPPGSLLGNQEFRP